MTSTPDGGFLIADTFNYRIRKVGTDGVISTVAGTGTNGFSGDGGPATAAAQNDPKGVSLTSDGGFLIADTGTGNDRIRKVGADGVINTVAGGADKPEVGRFQILAPVKGRVLVRRRGFRRFTRLKVAAKLKNGSEVDTTRGIVGLTVATDNDEGATASAFISGGPFIVDQQRRSNSITDLELSARLQRCRGSDSRSRGRAAHYGAGDRNVRASMARRRRARSRRLWTQTPGGRFRTKGKYASATVRGTKWLMRDTCRGTLVKVRKGSVTIRDFPARKTVIVKAPRKYLAEPRQRS